MVELPYSTKIVLLIKLATKAASIDQVTLIGFSGVIVGLLCIRMWFYRRDGLLSKACTGV